MTEHPAAKSGPSTRSPAPAEQPTERAELRIEVGPARIAHGKVPPGEAHSFIRTLGIVGSAFAGIAGTVLTVRFASGSIGAVLAIAELALALIAVVLIAVQGARRGR